MAGTDAFDVQASGAVLFDQPPGFEVSLMQPEDGGQPLVSGSAATITAIETEELLTSASGTARFTYVEGEDADTSDEGFQETLAPNASNEPHVGGSAATLSDLANRPQYSSAAVAAEDPGVSNLDPGLALPYGNDELGPAAVTGTIVVAPQTGGASGGVNPSEDPDILIADVEPITAGNNDSITTGSPVAPQTGVAAHTAAGSAGVASGDEPVLDYNVELLPPSVTLADGNDDTGVTGSIAVAPQTGGQASGQVVKEQYGEAGVVLPNPPTSQYGQSAP